MDSIRQQLADSIRASAAVLSSLADQADRLSAICDAVVAALRSGNKVLTMGHGGSAADALHMAEELVGRFDKDRRPLPAICLAADPTLMTCIVNDYGFEHLFPRQVEAHGQEGDVLVVFSTSGNGQGLRRSIEVAKRKGLVSVALLGKSGGMVKGLADHELIVASQNTARIQEAHTLILHLVLEAVEHEKW